MGNGPQGPRNIGLPCVFARGEVELGPKKMIFGQGQEQTLSGPELGDEVLGDLGTRGKPGIDPLYPGVNGRVTNPER